MSLYSATAVDSYISRLSNSGFNCVNVEDGVLTSGFWVCYKEGFKTVIIKEVYLNEWSSGQSIRLYNNCPKKYLKYIN